jgi:N-acetylglutamate synthase-like GNAT family acetyltransferase
LNFNQLLTGIFLRLGQWRLEVKKLNKIKIMDNSFLIRQLKQHEEIPYNLLLLADETIKVIDNYIHTSEIYVCEKQNRIVAVYVLTYIDKDTAEIKNIAVDSNFQGIGIGSRLLENATTTVIEKGLKFLIVGTPDLAHRQIKFYENSGFIKSSIKKDFFVLNYREPIFENGHQLRDMVILKKTLSY